MKGTCIEEVDHEMVLKEYYQGTCSSAKKGTSTRYLGIFVNVTMRISKDEDAQIINV